MKTFKIFLLSIFAFTTLLFSNVYATGHKKEETKSIEIIPCLSIVNDSARSLCNRERKLRMARRALNILSLDPGDSTHGGAADCAATAEDDCAGMLEDVDTLSYEGGVCSWTCKAFAIPPSGSN